MPIYLTIFVVLAFAWRIATVVISTKHEKALKREGATEVGAANSLLLAGAHVAFYIAATVEGVQTASELSVPVSLIGILIYLGSAAVLVSVIRSLGRIWTVKIIIAKAHPHVRQGLFARFRHPNYFLNILPELFAFALALNSYWTMVIGIPLYLVPLSIRIKQEEQAMRRAVAGYQ